MNARHVIAFSLAEKTNLGAGKVGTVLKSVKSSCSGLEFSSHRPRWAAHNLRYSKCRGPDTPSGLWGQWAPGHSPPPTYTLNLEKKQKFKVLYPFFNFEILSRFLPEYQTWNYCFWAPHPLNFHVKHYKGRNNKTICWVCFFFFFLPLIFLSVGF